MGPISTKLAPQNNDYKCFPKYTIPPPRIVSNTLDINHKSTLYKCFPKYTLPPPRVISKRFDAVYN